MSIMPNPVHIDDRLRLAGQCVRCVNYDLAHAVFTMECYSCSRYHGDMFEEREPPCTETVEK